MVVTFGLCYFPQFSRYDSDNGVFYAVQYIRRDGLVPRSDGGYPPKKRMSRSLDREPSRIFFAFSHTLE